MTTWIADIGASKAGSIGSLYYEKRQYTFEASSDKSDAIMKAISLAYAEGLEHVRVEKLIAQ